MNEELTNEENLLEMVGDKLTVKEFRELYSYVSRIRVDYVMDFANEKLREQKVKYEREIVSVKKEMKDKMDNAISKMNLDYHSKQILGDIIKNL